MIVGVARIAIATLKLDTWKVDIKNYLKRHVRARPGIATFQQLIANIGDLDYALKIEDRKLKFKIQSIK